jgi:hypothetical protein
MGVIWTVKPRFFKRFTSRKTCSPWARLSEKPLSRPFWIAAITSLQLTTVGKAMLQIESVREQWTVYIWNDCLRGTDSDESPT